GQHRPHRVARVRAADQLGRGARRGAGEAGHARAIPMTRLRRARRARVWPLVAILGSFLAGVIVDGYLRTHGPPLPADEPSAAADANAPSGATATSGSKRTTPTISAARPATGAPAMAPAPSARVNAPVSTTGNIRRSKLRVPIDGANVETWK